jgi:type 1 fimbriae regulatory protein FimB
VPKSQPPRKISFLSRREREFLYLEEVDALIAATQKTRSPIRNSAIALLLFCQSLQPIELCWLRWFDVNFTQRTLRVVRNRKSAHRQFQQVVNFQALCLPEVDLLEQLKEQRTTEWIFASERKQRLSDRSLHHIIQHAGKVARLDFPTHPYMLRRSGLYYCAALLLQPLNLSLHQCCLIWNWHTQNISRFSKAALEYRTIDPEQTEGFLAVLSQIKAFSGIQLFENVIDYVLGAYLLFPQLKNIPHDYWLAPLDSQINFAENTTKNPIRLLPL